MGLLRNYCIRPKLGSQGKAHSLRGHLPAYCKVQEISGVRSTFSTLFGKWQQLCGLSLSVLQQLLLKILYVQPQPNAQFTLPARHDKTVLSASCELDDCSERVQTSNFLSTTVLCCRESNSHRRSGRDTDKTVWSCLAWRCELIVTEPLRCSELKQAS